MSRYKNPICRGSWALGNNCKICERCLATKPKSDTDRIAELVAQVEALRACQARHLDEVTMTQANARGYWYRQGRDDQHQTNADRIEALTAENERLREALEPFRMVAYDYEGTPPCMAVNININLLRAARTALEGK